MGLAAEQTAVADYEYAVLTPQGGGSYREQLRDLAAQLRRQFSLERVLRLTVFFRDPAAHGELERLFREELTPLPQIAYVSQPPADGSLLILEVTVANGGSLERVNEYLTIERRANITWVHSHSDSLAGGHQPADSFGDTKRVLEHNLALLKAGGARLDQVFRTWFYMGSIVADDQHHPERMQRYKELNRARTVVFGDTKFLTEHLYRDPGHDIYPASTGIGMGGLAVALSCTALITDRRDVYTLPLENPRQTAAFAYGRHYSPETPKFARAMAVIHDDRAAVYVSGTASITASETVHPGDVAKQTEETLLNIATLIAPENFARAGFPGYGANLRQLAVVRAYIKHPQDYETVRRVCERQLAGVPVAYTIGDVCRDDLLVELEAVAHIDKI